MASRKDSSLKPLTQVELELMSILWKIGGGTVRDVQASLPGDRPLAYTSISTILRILEKKGVVLSQKEGRGHVYVPSLSKEVYESSTLKHMVSRVFDGTPSSLVRRLLEVEDLEESDLREIQTLLDEKLRAK